MKYLQARTRRSLSPRFPCGFLSSCSFRRFHSAAAILCLFSGLVLIAGCSQNPRSSSPYAPQSETDRNTTAAERLNREAADLIESDPSRAEKILRDALSADLYFGPAHNNLGIVYFQQSKLYEAASEFEWAKKLLPGHPDPKLNLALVLESAGRNDEALAMYTTALEVYPDHLPSMQGLVRLQIRTGQRDDRTRRYLEQIALRTESAQWRDWARFQAARFAE